MTLPRPAPDHVPLRGRPHAIEAGHESPQMHWADQLSGRRPSMEFGTTPHRAGKAMPLDGVDVPKAPRLTTGPELDTRGHGMEARKHLIAMVLDAQHARETAERAYRRQSEFFAVAIHELRRPLASISAASTMLSVAGAEEALSTLAKGVIARQSQQLARLLDDLLDIGRLQTGKLRIERRPVRFIEAITSAIEQMRPAMEARRQLFTSTLPPPDLVVMGDRDRLIQIFGNLLSNASSYTAEGGRVNLTVAVMADAVVSTVADNGIGIPAELLPRLFEPFAQGRRATVFNPAGLGVGLTVVRELVLGHAGSIVASSEGRNRGSRLEVTLPM